ARQPWAVFGLIKTADGVSTVVSAGAVLFTMIAFTVLYGVLAFIEVGLILRVIKMGPAEEFDYAEPALGGSADKPLVMSY
ncbi:MAG: cytochrome ubiquinol oxidase subunit I, partial [Actinobacteria bacterium]|nr:cytochrome ubiquinol oxidase subunit I [Actinomycetota bacterium]